MTEFIKTCLIVCPLVFLAGFIDSVAGGGGIISIPAYFVAGLPTRLTLGTTIAEVSIFPGRDLKLLLSDFFVISISKSQKKSRCIKQRDCTIKTKTTYEVQVL